MNPPLHTWMKKIITWAENSGRNSFKAAKGTTVDRKVYGLLILGCARYFIHWLPREKKTINSVYYTSLLERLNEEIKKKRAQKPEEKGLFHEDNSPRHKSMITIVKFYELKLEILTHPPYPLDLAPSDYYLIVDHKRMLLWKIFASNDEIIAKTNAYFNGKDKVKFWKKKCFFFNS